MNKVLKFTTTWLSFVLVLFRLTSCGLAKVETNAKAYMKANPDNYTNNNVSGLGFSYKSDNVSYDFTTDKGTYTSNNYEFKFTSSYNYETDDMSFNITKIVRGEEGFGLTAAESVCKIEVAAVYVTIELASSLYENSKSE